MKYFTLFAVLAYVAVTGCGPKVSPGGGGSSSSLALSPSPQAGKAPQTGAKTTAPKASSDKVKASDLGLPLYPGSVEDASGPNLISNGRLERRVISFRTTKDEPKKVITFYMHLGTILVTRDGDGYSNTVCCGGKTSTLLGTLKNGGEAKVVANLAQGKKLTVIEVTVKTPQKPA